LLRIKLLHKLHPEAEEVGELKDRSSAALRRSKQGELLYLCGSIDFSLPNVLALPEHSCRHELVAVLSASQFCGLEEDSRPIVPREGLPFFLDSESTTDSIADDLLVGFVIATQVVRMIKRKWLFNGIPGLDLGKATPEQFRGQREEGKLEETTDRFSINDTRNLKG